MFAFFFLRPQLSVMEEGLCFNTGTVLGLNYTTQAKVTMNLVIKRIPVHFPVWQLSKKSTEDKTVAQRNALIGAAEPGPRGESGTERKASGSTLPRECEGKGRKYSSYIYL